MCFKCGGVISKIEVAQQAYISSYVDDNSEESVDSGSIESTKQDNEAVQNEAQDQ
jgi:hypothetical protein